MRNQQPPLARSRQKIGVGYTGKIPPLVWEVLERASAGCIYLRSDFARAYAPEIAAAASLGWISSVHISGTSFQPFWLVTLEGLAAYRNRGV